jgi:hypothetical protein
VVQVTASIFHLRRVAKTRRNTPGVFLRQKVPPKGAQKSIIVDEVPVRFAPPSTYPWRGLRAAVRQTIQ